MKKILLTSLLLSASLLAEFKVGDTVPPIELSDQFDKKSKVTPSDKSILMAFEKDISITIAEYLKTKPSNFLKQQHTKYISDISAMPSLITSMFALPKMKKYPFSVLLIHDDFGKQFNQKDGKVTLFRLNKGKITSIEFLKPSEISRFFTRK